MSPTAATATKPQVIKSLAWLEKSDTREDMKWAGLENRQTESLYSVQK